MRLCEYDGNILIYIYFPIPNRKTTCAILVEYRAVPVKRLLIIHKLSANSFKYSSGFYRFKNEVGYIIISIGVHKLKR